MEDDLLSIFEGLDEFPALLDGVRPSPREATPKSCSSPCPKSKRAKVDVTVERNRRRQMNDNLSVLRSLMPCFYVKRGDQASIIGGVVDYINELQQILESLEAKKQRKVMSPSPRVVSNLPISPTTPQPGKPPRLHHLSPTHEPSLSSSSSSNNISIFNNDNDLVANSKSPLADVEVKFSGPNLLLKTVSPRIPGQAFKIVSALEHLSLEILHVNITTLDQTMLVSSFTIKIGIECQLSAQELAQQIQQTFG